MMLMKMDRQRWGMGWMSYLVIPISRQFEQRQLPILPSQPLPSLLTTDTVGTLERTMMMMMMMVVVVVVVVLKER